MKRFAVVVGVMCLTVGCGGGANGVPDPFHDGVAGGRLAADAVICNPSPSMCTRYVVLAPSTGTTQSALLQTAAAVVEQKLGWAPSQTAPVPAWEGLAFDGKSADDGGYIQVASIQLAHSHGDLDAGVSAKSGTRLMAAMRANPSGVVIRIMRNR